MNDLLDFVLDAHGGLKRWSGVSTLTVKLAVGGPFWGQQMAGWARGYPKLAESSGRSHDTAIQRRLWTVSEELTGVTFPV